MFKVYLSFFKAIYSLLLVIMFYNSELVSMNKAVNLTNWFHVAEHVFSNRSQMMQKCDKNKKVVHKAQPRVTDMFLLHFDVFCDLFLKRHTTWNLFVLHNKANIFLSYSDCIYLLPFNRSKERNNLYVQIVQLLMKISFQIYFWRTCAFFEIYWIKKTPSVLSIWSI